MARNRRSGRRGHGKYPPEAVVCWSSWLRCLVEPIGAPGPGEPGHGYISAVRLGDGGDPYIWWHSRDVLEPLTPTAEALVAALGQELGWAT